MKFNLVLIIVLLTISSLTSSAQTTADTTADTTEFVVVEQMPVFPKRNMEKWIRRAFKYPPEAKGIKGKVYVGFAIEKDGSLSNVEIRKGLHPLLDAEAIRVVKSMPNWKPGKLRGKPVRILSYTLPINFL